MSLSTIIARLREQSVLTSASYSVPGLWIDCESTAAQQVEPFSFYGKRLQDILDTPPVPIITGESGGGWTRNAIIYNLFPRYTAAFDHDGDGALNPGPNAHGWHETGSLLKCIALLPYLKYMGFNTIHLLPITSVGQDGKKGNLGSPYAIRNHYKLDENLDEPILGLSVETLFAAFMEAAHRMGFRVVVEFVLRTASKDGDLVPQHPEWFYWIRADIPDRTPGSRDPAAYGNPLFPQDALGQLYHKVNSGQLYGLPPPPMSYQKMFTAPPLPETIHMENGRWIGVTDSGLRVRIPGAFSDWPPEDNQPPWGDVTYLRMYDHPDFNYIAYNTIRMYDELSAQPEYRNNSLWDFIAGVIPHWQRTFGIDGVMIDMGHALPMPLKQRVVAAARAINPDFAFWDENFSLSAQSRAEGYNAVMGYLVFDMHQPHKVDEFLRMLSRSPSPIHFFAAPENHNTVRAAARPGGLHYLNYAIALMMSMPGLPFVLTGLELGETRPINTGLGFSNEMLAQFPAEELPLFSAAALNWTNAHNLVDVIKQAAAMRTKHQLLFTNDNPATIAFGYSDNRAILTFMRRDETAQVAVIANADPIDDSAGRIVLEASAKIGNGVFGINGAVRLNDELGLVVSLSPGQVLGIEY